MGWNNKFNVMTSQGLDENASKAGLLGDGSGIAVPLSCPQCSSEARVDLTWAEVLALSEGKGIPQAPGLWIDRTTTGYVLGRVCEGCSRHYAHRGVSINPAHGKEAAMRLREVSASRPVGFEMLLKWLAMGRARGLC